MMKQSRQLQIIRYLLKSNQFRTIQDIAKHHNVSNRTIRHDLDTLTVNLKEYDLTLIKKTGSGVLIQGTTQAKLAFESRAKDQFDPLQSLSPHDRKIYITLRVLTDEGIRIIDLIHELYVSRATIQKDIIDIKKNIASFQISLEQKGKNGLWFTGKERKIRNYMFNQMIQSSSFLTFESLIQNIDQECHGHFIFPGLDLTDDEIKAGFKTILKCEKLMFQNYTINNLSHLLIRVLIVCIRSNLGYSANLSRSFISELKSNQDAYKISENLISKQSFYKPLNCKPVDYYYLQIYVVAYQHVASLASDNAAHIDEFITYVIDYWNQHSSINLSKDLILLEDLRRHMNTADIRINYGIPICNPLLPEIKNYYLNTFQLLYDSIQESNLNYWKTISMDELGYITLYFASALERQKRKLNALLVSESARSAKSILIQRIASNIPEIQIQKTINSHEINDQDLTVYDCILTSNSLNISTQTPIILINNIVNDDDLINLKRIINPLYKFKNSPQREPI